jgi:hypothetical protein
VVSLPFQKKGGETPKNGQGPPAPEKPTEKDHELCKRKAAVLRKIIERYREQIEAGEAKTVPDLRNFIDAKGRAVQEVKQKIANEFRPYVYENNFLEAAEKAFKFLKDEIGNETLPVDFWLLPDDVLELKLADEMDKAIFLCSLLLALDNETAKVVVETNGARHAFVLFEFNGKFHLMDPVHDVNIIGSREEVLKQHLTGHDYKLVYEFNNKGYEEW